MPDSISVNIAAIFMAIGCFSLQQFYFSRMRFSTHWIPVSGGGLVAFGLSALFLSAVFAVFLGFSQIILAVALAYGICLSFTNPIIALSFFLINLLIRPWELLPDNSILGLIPRLLGLICIFSWGYHRMRLGRLRLEWNRESWVLILFIFWTLLSAVFNAGASGFVEQMGEVFKTFFPVIILSILILNSVTDAKDQRTLINSLIIGITGAISVAIYLTLSDPQFAEIGVRLNSEGLIGNPNDLASMIALALPFLFFRFIKSERPHHNLGITFIYIFILLYGLYLSQSRGAILAIVLGCGVYFLISSKKLSKFLTLGLFVLPVPLILFFAIDRGADDLEGSTASRWNYAVAGLRMAKSNPVFGVGMNNYPVLYERYTPEFFEWGQRTAHSSWILALAETGILGFFLFVLLFIIVLNRTWKIKKEYPAYFVSMIMYGTTMSFLSHTFLIVPYIGFFICLAGYRVFKNTVVPLVALIFAASLLPSEPTYAATTKRHKAAPFTATAGSQKPIAGSAPQFSPNLKLFGSRGETLNFQIKIEEKGCNDFVATGLPFEFKFFEAQIIKTEYPSFKGADVGEHFDPLIPLQDGKLCPSRLPALIWGEVSIPKSTEPKLHQGKLVFGKHSIPVSINVWKMQMPDEVTFPAYSELTTWFVVLGHFGKWNEAQARISQMYFEEMVAHRMIPVKSWVAFPKVKSISGKPNLDLRNEPTPNQSFFNVTLAKRPKWALFDYPTVPSEDTDKSTTPEYFKAMENANQTLDRKSKAFVYLWDEPEKQYFPKLKKLAKIAKTNAPSVKVMVTTPYNADLEPYVDIFAPVMDQFDVPDFPKPAQYKAFQKKGKQVWWYISCLSHGCDYLSDSQRPDFVIDRPSAYVRSIPWLSFRYGIDHFLYYAVVEGYKKFPKRDPWKSLWDFSGNGDGTLFYPGRPGMFHFKDHTPVPSIRLKLWREASFDYEYLNWISKNPPAWLNKELAKIAKSTQLWSRNYSEYQALKEKIGNYLNNSQ